MSKDKGGKNKKKASADKSAGKTKSVSAYKSESKTSYGNPSAIEVLTKKPDPKGGKSKSKKS